MSEIYRTAPSSIVSHVMRERTTRGIVSPSSFLLPDNAASRDNVLDNVGDSFSIEARSPTSLDPREYAAFDAAIEHAWMKRPRVVLVEYRSSRVALIKQRLTLIHPP